MRDNGNRISRRDALRVAAVGAVVAGLPRLSGFAAQAKTADPGIALQLYSVREDCGKDFDKALEEVAKMGFEAVEFAGYHKYDKDPKKLRKRLDDLGLKVAGTHRGTGTLVGDALKDTIEFHQTIGCKYVIVPGDERFNKPDGNKELAEIFNKAAEELKKYDMYTGYHNHTHEFEKDGETTYWELFAQRTSQDVVLQQDVGWTTAARQDPVALIRKYPGRHKIVHCKPTVVDGQGKAYIGEDSVKWEPIIAACKEVGGTEWFTIEQESYPDGKSPMECTKISLAGFRKILAQG